MKEDYDDLTIYHPNDDELELINSRNPIPLRKDSGIVLRIHAVNREEDRGKDVFEEYAMERMGQLSVKNRIPILLAGDGDFSDHFWMSKNTKGFVFDYELKDNVLYYKAFFPLTSTNRPVVENILHGLYTKGSVGFAINPKDYICSACDRPIVSKECPHVPGDDGVFTKIKDVVDNFEYSLVAVPMVPDSGIPKQKGVILMQEEDVKVEENLVETEEKLEEIPVEKTIKINLELNEESKNLLASLENFSKNLTNDKITYDDTIQDNKMSEEVIEQKEEEIIPDSHAELMGCMKEMKDNLAGLHEKVDSLMAKMLEMESVEEPSETKEESKEEPEVEVKSTKKSFEERLNEEIPDHRKSVNDKLWERLTMGVN